MVAPLSSHLEEQMKKEQEYWKHMRDLVITAVCTLSEHGLTFGGGDEKFDLPHDRNFLGLIDQNPKFQRLHANHINHYGTNGCGKPSYFSKKKYLMISSIKLRNHKLAIIFSKHVFNIALFHISFA
jgi:hypothetical protein